MSDTSSSDELEDGMVAWGYKPTTKSVTEEEETDEFEKPLHERPISSSSFGYKLLQKLGWKEGTGLGTQGQGIKEPISTLSKTDLVGVGKNEELNEYHTNSTSSRRQLEAEIIAGESELERTVRKEKVEKKLEVQKELTNVLASFYCALCDKQYAKASEYETHLDSYDHHHKKRFKEMAAQQINAKRAKKSTKLGDEPTPQLPVGQGITVISQPQGDLTTPSTSSWTTVTDDPPIRPNSDLPALPKKPLTFSMNGSNSQSNKPFKFVMKKK